MRRIIELTLGLVLIVSCASHERLPELEQHQQDLFKQFDLLSSPSGYPIVQADSIQIGSLDSNRRFKIRVICDNQRETTVELMSANGLVIDSLRHTNVSGFDLQMHDNTSFFVHYSSSGTGRKDEMILYVISHGQLIPSCIFQHEYRIEIHDVDPKTHEDVEVVKLNHIVEFLWQDGRSYLRDVYNGRDIFNSIPQGQWDVKFLLRYDSLERVYYTDKIHVDSLIA